VVGIPRVAGTLQQDRTSADGNPNDDEPGQTPLLETVPTLAEMARGALNVVDNDPDGFFLMVEGGAIDWAGGAQLGRMIEETMDFVAAIEAVAAWVDAHSNWNETLVVITADHETGYITGPGSDPDWTPVKNNGKGKMPEVESHGGHTNSLVPLFVRGLGAEAFEKAASHEDPKRGKYLDSTDIGKTIGALLAK
jgi:alkaline phosphatase